MPPDQESKTGIVEPTSQHTGLSQPSSSDFNVPTNKKKIGKPALILSAVIVLVALIGIGIFLYKNHVSNKNVTDHIKNSNSSLNPAISIPDKSDAAYQTLYNIELALAKKYSIEEGQVNPPNEKTLAVEWYPNNNYSGNSVPYQVAGDNFYVGTGGYEIDVNTDNSTTEEQAPYVYDSNVSESVNDTIMGQFSSNKFTESETPSGSVNSQIGYIDGSHVSNINTFTDASVSCNYTPLIQNQSDSTDPQYQDNTGTFIIDCGDLSDASDQAATIKPFANLYYAQNPLVSTSYNSSTGVQSPPQLAYFYNPIVKSSNTSGYMIATIGVIDYYHMSPSIGYFYEKNNSWLLYYVANDASNTNALQCSYNDASNATGGVDNLASASDATDANLAFAGQPCGGQFGTKPSTAQ